MMADRRENSLVEGPLGGTSVPIIHSALAEHYGFTDEEPDFIVNCDTKCRTGREETEETTT